MLLTTDTEYEIYTVEDSSETLDQIAKKNGITLQELIALNDIRDINVYVGQEFIIAKKETYVPPVNKTDTTTDDSLEDMALNAAKQNTNAENNEIRAVAAKMKEEYLRTGTLDNIYNEINYLNEKGYTNEEIATALNESDINDKFTDVKGTTISDYLVRKKNESNSIVEDTNFSDSYIKDSILGLPFRFNALADLRRRIYNSTYLADGAVVSVIPGRPFFRKANELIKKAMGDNQSFFDMGTGEAEFLDNPDGFGVGSSSKIDDIKVRNWLLKSQKNIDKAAFNMDLRYYGFKLEWERFLKYLELLTATVGVKMNISQSTKSFSSMVKTMYGPTQPKRTISFYVGKGISLSQSVSNEFGDSLIANASKSISDMAKEVMFLFSSDDAYNLYTEDGKQQAMKANENALSSAASSIANFIGGYDGAIGTAAQTLQSSLNGVNIVYPEIWKDSKYSQSITLNMNFVAPYGTPDGVFNYVYFPFLTWYTLAFPQQVGVTGFTSPFILKVDCPGYFTSDLAVITNMSWTKGGNEMLFSKDGLPLSMTVSVTIKDLYPMIMLAGDFGMLRHNTGLHGFLDNMAGLAIERYQPFTDIKNSIKARLEYNLGGFDREASKIGSWVYRLTMPNIN